MFVVIAGFFIFLIFFCITLFCFVSDSLLMRCSCFEYSNFCRIGFHKMCTMYILWQFETWVIMINKLILTSLVLSSRFLVYDPILKITVYTVQFLHTKFHWISPVWVVNFFFPEQNLHNPWIITYIFAKIKTTIQSKHFSRRSTNHYISFQFNLSTYTL